MYDEKSFAEKRFELEDRLAAIDKDIEEGYIHVETMRERTRINFALRRLSEGQYGLCVNCGCPIAPDRLNVVPDTLLCSICALESTH